MKETEDQKNIFSEWLEKLQQESWQLELLISGFALYGIWESQTMLEVARNYLTVNSSSEENSIGIVFNIFVLMLRAGWAVFFINLLIHVILRGLWIGAIGLRYVSGDIEYDELHFSDYFNDYFKRRVGRFDDYIERLEKVCSVIFAYTFLLFFIFLSFALFIVFTVLLTTVLDFSSGTTMSEVSLVIMLVFQFFAMIVFIDFITLGAFKKVKNKNFSKGYSYIYRFYSLITLSFIYRPLLYNFIDYKYTRRLFWFSIPYVILLTMILPNFAMENNPYFPLFSSSKEFNRTSREMMSWYYYDELRDKNLAISGNKRRQIRTISLGNFKITDSYGSLFLRQKESDEKLFLKKYGIAPYRETGLYHRIWGNEEKDSLIVDLENQKSIALLKIIKENKKIKKDSTKKGGDGFVEDFKRGRNSQSKDGEGEFTLQGEDKKDFKNKKDSVIAFWNKKIELVKEEKLLSIKDAMLAVNEISIDGQPYNEHLSCKFYVHPNMNEKGLLCFFPVDSLAQGEHILTLDRTYYSTSGVDSLKTITTNIPFWKMKNN